MTKNLLPTFIILLFSITMNAQTWEKLFSARSTDVFRSVREVPAGGYICAGYTADSSANDSDAYAVRLTTAGDTIWTYKYNGPGSRKDLFYKVIPTADGGFAFCGYTTGNAGSDDLLVLKLTSTGNFQWVKTWGGNQRERGQDIIQTSDGNYTIAGYTTSAPATYYDAFMVRMNQAGDILWTKLYGGGAGSYDDANSIKQLSTGEYILGGQSSNGVNGLDQYLVKTDTGGVALWQKRFGTTYTDNIEYIALLSDGFIIAGTTHDTLSGDDGYLVRTDTSGTVQWAYSYGGTQPDDFHRVELTSSGDFICSGTTSSSGPAQPNMWLAKISSTGTLIWSKTFGGDNHDHGYSGQETSDGGFILAGHTGSYGYNYEEAYVVKTDASGNISNKLVYTTVLNLVSPASSTCGSASTPVMLKLRNFSNAVIPNIPVTVQVTGALTQTFNQTFSASSDTVTLGTINTSAGGTYTFTCTTGNNNDVYPQRNGITVTLTIPALQSPPVVTGDQRCGNGPLNLSATSAGTVYWFTSPNGGVSVFTGNNYTTPSLSSTTTYYAQTGSTCPSARIPVVATVYPVPANPVVSNGSRCGSGTVNLSVTSAATVNWFTVSSGGASFHTGLTYTTPSLSSTTTYYVEADNGNCTSARIPITATISSAAADPVTTNGTRCGAGVVVLHATSADSVNWYDSSSGGNLLGTGSTFTTQSISSTTTFYAQADNGCVSNRIAAIATVNTLAADPVTADVQNCGPGSVTLNATSNDQLNWYDAPAGGNQVGTGVTFTTPVVSATTIYYVEAFDGTCPSNRIAVNVIINPLPAVDLGPDTNVTAASFTIDAGQGFTSYLWSDNSTAQTLNVTTTGQYCVVVTGANNCTNTDCIQVDFANAVSEPGFSRLSIFPNPSNGIFTFEKDEPGKVQIIIYSPAGQVVKTFSMTTPGTTIDLSACSKGIYQLTIIGEKGISNRKITVQ